MSIIAHRLMVAVVAAALTVIAVAPARADDEQRGGGENERAGALPWPERRFAPCAAFDAEESRWHVFGGRTEGTGEHHRDAWALNLRPEAGQPRWRLLAGADAPGAPPPLRSCAAAFDPVGRRLIIFAGWNGVTPTNGVWALTVDGAARWTRLCDAESCGAAPTARRAATMGYDAARRRLVVVGGLDTTFRSDVWALSLEGAPRWTQMETAGVPPAARASHAHVQDGRRDRVWIIGGTTAGNDLDDTWYLDLGALTWTRVPATGGPSARSGALAVLDTAGDQIVLTAWWESGPDRYPADAFALRGLDGVPAWAEIAPASETPQPRFAGVAAYDPVVRRMLIFGGGVAGGAEKDLAALHLPVGAAPFWRGIAPRTGLTARDQVAIHFEPETRNVYAFGGFGSGGFPGNRDAGTHLADTWQLSLRRDGAGRWRNATATNPAAVPLSREAGAVASDPERHRMIVFGGLTGDVELADVWLADFSREGPPRWRQLCTPASCGAGPAARWGGVAVYDPAGDRFITFGGRRTDGTSFDDTWALSLGANPRWTRLQPAGAPPPARWGGAAVYDPLRHRLVISGGQGGADFAATQYNDTWALTLDGAARWSRLDPSGTPPSPRRSPAYARRVERDARPRGVELLVVGGLTLAPRAHHNDVWRLRLDSADGAWEQLIPDSCGEGAGPPCGRSAGAVHDAARDELVLIFGRDDARFFADAHAFAIDDRAWRPVTSTCAPSRPCVAGGSVDDLLSIEGAAPDE